MCATETTIGRMKIGDKLLFGAYGVSNDDPHPILWLKGTPNGDFITQDILDYIAFDARERNSESYSIRNWGNSSYPFEDYETSAIVLQEITVGDAAIQALIRLPSFDDILGPERFKLFSKKGVRAHGTSDFFDGRGIRLGFSPESFIEFWLSSPSPQDDGKATIVSRSATFQKQYPYAGSGLRPVCTLRPDTVVELDDNGVFHVKPSELDRKVFTDDELMALLGMARP